MDKNFKLKSGDIIIYKKKSGDIKKLIVSYNYYNNHNGYTISQFEFEHSGVKI